MACITSSDIIPWGILWYNTTIDTIHYVVYSIYDTTERRCAMLGCQCDVLNTPSIFEDRCVDFEDRCINFRRSMCRPSEIDVSTFEDRCVDFRRSMIEVSTFEDRCEIMLLGCLACVCVSIRSFLPPHASRPRNIGTYVFTATRKTLLYNYYNRNFCWKCFVQKLRPTSFACLECH